MKIFVVGCPRKGLNIRQLLNPIFYTPAKRHPDRKRQRGARQRAKDLTAARRLKAQYVPLCHVDRTVYLEEFNYALGRYICKEVRYAEC